MEAQPTTDIISIKPIEAELHEEIEKKHQFLNEAFCVVKLGEKTVKTRTGKGTVLKPAWKETITLPKVGGNLVKIEVWSKNKEGLVLLIGTAEILIGLIKDNGYSSSWYDLRKDVDNVGQLLVVAEYLPATTKTEEEEKVLTTGEINLLRSKSHEVSYKPTAQLRRSSEIQPMTQPEKPQEVLISKEKNPRSCNSVQDETGSILYDFHDPQYLKKKLIEQKEREIKANEKIAPIPNLGRPAKSMQENYKRTQG